MVRRTRRYALMLCALIVSGVADSASATVVSDYELLEISFQETRHTVTTFLAVEGRWTQIEEEGILDILDSESPFTAVMVHFRAPAGSTFRVCLRRDDAATWTCAPEGTQDFVYAMDVPAAGLDRSGEYYVEMADPKGTTIASHGYLRIKKLNSG